MKGLLYQNKSLVGRWGSLSWVIQQLTSMIKDSLMVFSFPLRQPSDHKMAVAVECQIQIRQSPKKEAGFPPLSLWVRKLILRCPLQISVANGQDRFTHSWLISYLQEELDCRAQHPWAQDCTGYLNKQAKREGPDSWWIVTDSICHNWPGLKTTHST